MPIPGSEGFGDSSSGGRYTPHGPDKPEGDMIPLRPCRYDRRCTRD
jgi:hypothetical protein